MMTGIVDGRIEEASVLGTVARIRRDISMGYEDRYVRFVSWFVLRSSP